MASQTTRSAARGRHGTAPAIELTGLRIERRGLCLLAGLSLRLRAGAPLAVMGASGSGKTTLLRVLAGLVEPEGGAIHRGGARAAFVFQEPRLLPWRTARDNVALVLDGDRRREIAEAWLARLGLADAAGLYPGALSGGMQRRVGIARALAVNPDIVLVDEPFSSLDVLLAERLRGELTAHLAERARIVVWVTHDPREAAAVADRTLLMGGPPAGRVRLVEHADPSDGVDLPRRLVEALGELSYLKE